MLNLIKDEKCKILNSGLFVASATKDFECVKRLILNGANINYIGSGGNTPLHCAVKDSSVGIVKYLLQKGADIYIENGNGEIPFDFVNSSKLKSKDGKKIKAKLQNTIIKSAFAVLETHVNHTESSQQDVAEDPEVSSVLICTEGFKWKNYSYDEDSSYLDQDFFREVNKKADKIKSCLRHIHGELSPVGTKFGYEQANIFIFFLETVAFQDVELSGESKRQIRKEMERNKKSENEIKKEIDTTRKQLVNDVKGYFTSTYYPTGFEEDIKLVDVARTILCHSSNKKIRFEDVAKLLSPGTSMKALFFILFKYVSYICHRIDNFDETDGSDQTETIPLTSVLAKIRKQDNLDIGIPGEDVLEEELANLIRATYNQEEWTRERTQEILFSFLVNISPTFGDKVSGLSRLRNKIIHEFHKYKDVDSIIKMEFKKAVFDLRSKLFKYYYAKSVNKILQVLKPSEDPENIKNKLSSALIEFENDFGEQFKIASQEDAGDSFEYRCYSTSEVTESFSKGDMLQYINQYLKFMSIVDDDQIEQDKENRDVIVTVLENLCDENRQNSDEEEVESENFKSIFELNNYKRREIYDKFLKLKQQYISIPSREYLREKKVFKSELTKHYGVNGQFFYAVCRMYVENDDDLQPENQKHAKMINDTINIVIRFQSDNNLSIGNTISLYRRVVETNFDHLENKEIRKSVMNIFQRDLSSIGLHKAFVLEVSIIGEQSVKLNAVEIVSNILNLFYNRYNSYQIKFNNIEEAFKDKEFLDNLIEQEKVPLKTCTDNNKNFDYHYCKFMIFKKLLKIEYTAPYMARSLIEEGHFDTMEKEDMILLTRILLKNNDNMGHVRELLKLPCEGVDLYKPVCDKVLKGNAKEMRQIFEEPIHVKKILQFLKEVDCEDEIKIKMKNEVIKLLNDIVYKLYCSKNYDLALEMLSTYSAQLDTESFDFELLEAKRLEARIRICKGRVLNWKSRPVNNSDESNELKIALNILYDIKTTMKQKEMMFLDIKHYSMYLLTLSHIAYAYHLLKKNDKSISEQSDLICQIKLFTLGDHTVSFNPRHHSEYKSLINIVQLKRYTDLLAYSYETKEFLDVFKILKHIGNQQLLQSRRVSSTKNALKLLKDSLYIFKKVFYMQKVIKSQDLYHISDTARRIGAACIYLAHFHLKYFSEKKDVIKDCYTEALLHYTLMNTKGTEKQQGHNTIILMSVDYVYLTFQSACDNGTISLDQVRKDTLVNKLTMFRDKFPSKKFQNVKFCCKQKPNSRIRQQSKFKKKRSIQAPSTKALSAIIGTMLLL